MRGSDVIGETRLKFCKLTGRCGIPSSLTSWLRQLVFDACQPRLRPGNCALLTYIHSYLSTTAVAGVRGGVGAVGLVGGACSAAVGVCVGVWCWDTPLISYVGIYIVFHVFTFFTFHLAATSASPYVMFTFMFMIVIFTLYYYIILLYYIILCYIDYIMFRFMFSALYMIQNI
jgi:hypothetical protein